jgi:hypothetical protein
MITKGHLDRFDYEYKKIKTITIKVEDGCYFEITRDYGKFDAECSDHTEFEWDCYGNERDFTEEEKQDIMNLYYNDEFEEWLEW